MHQMTLYIIPVLHILNIILIDLLIKLIKEVLTSASRMIVMLSMSSYT